MHLPASGPILRPGLSLGLGNLGTHLRSAELGEDLAAFDKAAAIHEDALHIPVHLGVYRDALKSWSSPGNSIIREIGFEITVTSEVICDQAVATRSEGSLNGSPPDEGSPAMASALRSIGFGIQRIKRWRNGSGLGWRMA